MVVMMGPFDFFTTSRSGETLPLTTGGGAEAASVCCFSVGVQPVITAAELTAMAEGHEIRTVESLEVDGELDPVQMGFHERHALQCGFCTPGMLMTARALLDENPNPTEQEIRDVEQTMAAPGFYDDRAAAQPVIDRHQSLMWQVGDLMHQWEELQSAADLATAADA